MRATPWLLATERARRVTVLAYGTTRRGSQWAWFPSGRCGDGGGVDMRSREVVLTGWLAGCPGDADSPSTLGVGRPRQGRCGWGRPDDRALIDPGGKQE